MPDINLTDVKLVDQVSRYEIDGHEIDGPDMNLTDQVSSHEIAELRQPIGAKFCTVVCTGLSFENWIETFGGSSHWVLPKKLGAKNMQNLAQFKTTSNFDGEYLRNR